MLLTRILNCSLNLLIALVVWPVPGIAIELYKYINEDGVVVLDSQIPARYVAAGYTVLSADGRVLKVVERALTEEELIEKARKDEEEQRRKLELEAQRAADETLMRLYSTPEDVNRAREAKLATVESFINSATGNLQRLTSQKMQYESRAAEIERAGGTISRENVDIIQSLISRIAQTESEIENKRREIDKLNLEYDKDLKRVKELYGFVDENTTASQ